MTVAALAPSIEYLENGVSLTFAIPFRFLAGQHLEVKRIAANGTVTTLAYGVAYSVAGGGTDAGGTLTLGTSVAGSKLRIRRRTPRAQQADYEPNDNFPARTHEDVVDRAMLIAQEQDQQIDDTAGRALMVPEGAAAPALKVSGLTDGDLLEYRAGRLQKKDLSASAGKYAGIDSLGQLVGVDGGLPSGVPALAMYIGMTGGGNVDDAIRFVTPEMFNRDIQAAADYAAANNRTLMTGPNDYTISASFAPHDITWISDNTRIIQPSTAAISVLRPGSNLKHVGRTFLQLADAGSGTANRAHVLCGRWDTGEGIENFHFDEFVLEGGHTNCNGFSVAGDSHNIRGRRIDAGTSTKIGRAFMAHWANFDDHYLSSGTYQHAGGAGYTTHPYDIVIDEVVGDLTLSTGDFCALWCVSAGYDIQFGRVAGSVANTGSGPGNVVLYTAGDLGMAYADPDIQALGMRGLAGGTVSGRSSHQGYRRIGRALYYNNDSTPQDAADYFVRIHDMVREVDIEQSTTTNLYCAVDGYNGYGSTRIGMIRSRLFRSAAVFSNFNRDVFVDIIDSRDNRNQGIQLVGSGDTPSEWPTNINIGTLRVDGTGISEVTAGASTASNINKVVDLQIGSVVIDGLKGDISFAAASIQVQADARSIKIGKVIQNVTLTGQTVCVSNLNAGNNYVAIGDVVCPTALTPLSGGYTRETVGGHDVFGYAGGAIASGITVRAGDRFEARAAGSGQYWTSIVKTGGVTGSTASVEGFLAGSA